MEAVNKRNLNLPIKFCLVLINLVYGFSICKAQSDSIFKKIDSAFQFAKVDYLIIKNQKNGKTKIIIPDSIKLPVKRKEIGFKIIANKNIDLFLWDSIQNNIIICKPRYYYNYIQRINNEYKYCTIPSVKLKLFFRTNRKQRYKHAS